MIPLIKREQLPPRSRYTFKITSFGGIEANQDITQASLNTAKYCYNVGIKDGILVNGKGINNAEVTLESGANRVIPNMGIYVCGIKKPFLYRKYDKATGIRDDRIIVLGSDGFIYQVSITAGNFLPIQGIPEVTGDVNFCNYHFNGKDTLLITMQKGGMYVYDGTSIVHYPDAPKLGSVCMHYERLFGADAHNPTRLHYSNDLNPVDWEVKTDGAGYIDFMDEGGEIIKVISFKDYIYIFRDHSVVRLTAFVNPTEYTVSTVFYTSGFIKAESVVVENQRLFFVADTYLYSMDGYNAVRMLSGLSGLIDSTAYTCCSCFDNKLYIAVRLKKNNDIASEDEVMQPKPLYNNGFIEVDLQTGGLSVFRGTSIRGFFPLVSENISEMLVYFGNFRMAYFGKLTDSGNLFGTPLSKVWRSPISNMGSLDKVKALRRIYLFAKYGLSLEAGVGDSVKQMQAYGADKPSMLPIGLVGDTVYIKLSTQNDKIFVTAITLEFDTIRRYNAD